MFHVGRTVHTKSALAKNIFFCSIKMIFIVQYLEADNTFVVTLYMVGGFLN